MPSDNAERRGAPGPTTYAGSLRGAPLEVEPLGETASGDIAAFKATIPDHRDWQVAGHVAVRHSALVISRLTIEPADPWGFVAGSGVGSSVLRAIPVAEILGAVRTVLITLAATNRLPAEMAALPKATPDQGRPGYPKAKFFRVAEVYLELQAAGFSKGLHAELLRRARTEEWGFPTVSEATVKSWVIRATKLGFLSAGTRGRVGREPGPNYWITRELLAFERIAAATSDQGDDTPAFMAGRYADESQENTPRSDPKGR